MIVHTDYMKSAGDELLVSADKSFTNQGIIWISKGVRAIHWHNAMSALTYNNSEAHKSRLSIPTKNRKCTWSIRDQHMTLWMKHIVVL